MSQLEGAHYRVRFPAPFLDESGLTPERLGESLGARVETLLAHDRLIVRRQGENQTREFDARPSIDRLLPEWEDGRPVLDVTIRFTVRAQARPDEVVGLLVPEGDARTLDVERTGLWADRGGRRLAPLELLSIWDAAAVREPAGTP